MRTLRPFNFNTAAELFPAAIRKKKRAGFAYRRFGTAAEAVRFAMEELPADSLNGAYLQVEEARFDQSGIRTLYESEAFPLERRPRPRRPPTPTPTRRNHLSSLQRKALGPGPGAFVFERLVLLITAAASPSSA